MIKKLIAALVVALLSAASFADSKLPPVPTITVYPVVGSTSAAGQNATLLQAAFNRGGHVAVECPTPGEFWVNAPIYAKSNTAFDFSAACTWGQASGTNSYQFANYAVSQGWTTLQNSNGSITTGPQAVIWSASTPAWTSGATYAAGAYVTSAGNIYWTAAGGVAGATRVQGTGTGISDGTVSWNYVTAAYALNSTSVAWSSGITVTAGGYYYTLSGTGGNLYWASTGCTASVSPSGTGTGIAPGDGCVYNYVSAVQTQFGNATTSYLYATINWPSHGRSVGDAVHVTPTPDLPQWASGQTYMNNMAVYSNLKVYKANAICTSGATPPTANGTVSDGGCTWVQQSLPAWSATTYSAGQYVTNGGNVYIETVASCTATTAPTTQTLQITDNTCRWNYQASTSANGTPAWNGANSGVTQGGFIDSAYFGVFKVVAVNDSNWLTVALRRSPAAAFSGAPISIRAADQNITITGGGTFDYNWLNNNSGSGITKETMIMAGVYNLNIDGIRGINQNNHILDMNGVAVSDVAHINVGAHSGTINTELVKVYGPYFDGTLRDLSGLATDDVISYQTQDSSIFAQYVVACGDIIGAKAQRITSEGGNAANVYTTHQFLLTDQIAFEDVDVHNSITLRSPFMIFGAPSGFVTTGTPTIGNISIKRGSLRDQLGGNYPYVQVYAASASSGTGTGNGSGPVTIQHLDIDGGESPFAQNQTLITGSTGRIFGALATTSAGVTINNLSIHNVRAVVGTTSATDSVFVMAAGTYGVVTFSDSYVTTSVGGQGYLFYAGASFATPKRIIERNNYIYNLGSVNRVFTAENIDFDGNVVDSAATTDAIDVVNVSGSVFTFRNNTINNANNGLVRFNTGPYSATVYSQGGNILTTSTWFAFPSPGSLTAYGVIDGGVAQRVVTAAGGIAQLATDQVICVNKSTGAATAVTLLTNPWVGETVEVQDCKGDANTNNITMTPAAGNIDASATYVINTAYGVWRGQYNGTIWKTEYSR